MAGVMRLPRFARNDIGKKVGSEFGRDVIARLCPPPSLRGAAGDEAISVGGMRLRMTVKIWRR